MSRILPLQARLLLILCAGLLPTAAYGGAPAPDFSKLFTPDTIGPGSVSTLTFTILNNDGGSGLEDMAFTDTLPVGVTIADPANASTDCTIADGGAGLSAPDGGGTISFSDGKLSESASCTLSVDVTSSVVGTHINTSSVLASDHPDSGTATDDLDVVTTLPGFSKAFAPSTVPLGDRSTLTFTIDNTANASGVGNLSFTDNLPTGMVVADPANAMTDCESATPALVTTLTAVPGTGVVILDADGSIFGGHYVVFAGASCTVTVDVVAIGSGELDNVTDDLQADFTSAGKASATLEVTVTPIALRKSFSDDPVAPGGSATLDFTIDNFDRSDSATAIAFTDDLTTLVPALAGLTFDSLLANSCGGSVMGAGTTTITFSGGTLGPEGSCTISVSLTVPLATVPGTYTNTSGAVSGTVGVTPVVGNMASDDLYVEPAPILTKEFLEVGTFDPDPVVNAGDDVVLRFTVTNPSITSGATDVAFLDELTDGSAGLPPDLTSGFLPFPVTVSLPPDPDPPCGVGSSLALVSRGDERQALELTGGSLDPAPGAGSTCTFEVTLTIPDDLAPGVYLNTTEEPTATIDGATRSGESTSDTLTVIAAPSLSKAFTDDPVAPGETVTLEFTLSHSLSSPADATGITFTDDLTFLAGLAAAAGQLPMTGLCPAGDGSLTGSAGDTLLTFSGATLMPGEDCTFSLTLDVPLGSAAGGHTNTTSGVGATVGGVPTTAVPASDDLEIQGLTFTKEFIGDPVIAGDTVTLRFTIDNVHPTDDATITLFTDSLNTALTGLAATGAPTFDDCGGALSGTTSLLYVGGSVLSGASCTIEVPVLVPLGTADDSYLNVTSSLAANQGGAITVDPATDELTVTSSLLQLTKEFTDDPVNPGDAVTLDFTLTNLDAANAASDIDFTDDLDAALSSLTYDSLLSNDCGATVTGLTTTTITVTGASLAAAGTCTISVSLGVPGGAAAGIYANTTSDLTGVIGGFTVFGAAAGDDLEVVELLSFSKSFDGPTTATGTAILTFTITNPGASAANDLDFSDNLDDVISGLTVTDVTLDVPPCGGLSSLSGTGTGFLTFSGGELPPMGGMCSFDVEVTVPPAATAGTYPNITSELFDGGLPVGEPATADLVIEPAPTFAKAFSPGTILAGGTSTLTFTIDNSASALAASSLDFTDGLPAGVEVATVPNAATTCTGGTLTAVAGTGTVSYTGGSIADGASCTVSVDVTSITSGMHANTTGDLTSSSGNSGIASDTLTVSPAADLSVTKTDGVTSATPGGSVTYTIVVANAGPSDDPAMVLNDTFPSPPLTCTYTSVAAGGAGGNTAGSGNLSETLSMPSGSMVTYTVTCSIDADATGTLSNTASITPSITDTASGNNSATDDDTVLDPEADLSVTKDDGVTSAVPGQDTLTYTIVASNDGPSDDPSATVTDTFPADLTCSYTSVAAGGASGNTAGSGDIADSLSLPSGSSVTYTVTCTIDAAATGTLSNTANISGSVTDPDSGNDSATDDDTVLDPEADLSVTKDDGVTSAVPGQDTLTYTIVASNDGPSDDPSATVTDTFPADLTCSYTSVAAGGATGNTAGSGDLSDTLSLPSGSSVTYTVTCTIDAAATGTLSNTATISGSVTDPDSGNDSATDDDTVLDPEADLSVTKDDGVTSAVPGQDTLTYTIVASNDGPSDDPSATVTDTFPADLTCSYTSVAAGGATGNTAGSGDLSDTLSLPSGSSVTYTVTCTIDAAATGTLSNTADISGSVTDPDSGNDSATDDDTVLEPEADLSISKDDGVTSAVPGQDTLTYTIVASNDGPSDDPAATVTDTFPADLTCSYTSVAAGGATGNTADSGDLSDTLSLPAGSSVTYTVTCDIDADATGTLSNTATISGSVTDPDSGNDSATDDDTVLEPEADLGITKTDGVTAATPGESLIYTIVASNDGPSDDPAATVTDTFPADLTCSYTSVAAGGATGNTAGSGDLADSLSLPVGSSVTYTVTCTIDSGATGTLTNTATITASVTDPDTGDNSATDDDTVLGAEADLAITKTDGVTAATPGETILTYTIVASNAGPSDDPAATVADTFPADLTCTWTSVAAGGATGNTAAGAGDIAESLSLPAGSSVTYTAECSIDKTATGTLSNTATVAASVTDPDTGNNSATDDDTVLGAEADLGVDKDGPTDVTVGGQVTYTLTVTNHGPSAATGVTLDDPTPAGLVFVSATAPCAGGFPCALGTMGLGDVIMVNVTFEVPFDFEEPSPIVNIASVSSDAADDNPDNDSATAETEVVFDLVPPTVTDVATAAGTLAECDTVRLPITRIEVTIEDDLAPIENAGEAASYLLLEAGVDRAFSTADCAGPAGDDVPIEIVSLSLVSTPPTAVAGLNFPGLGLDAGLYRLLACDEITDAAGNALDGDGDSSPGGDFVLPFFRADPLNLFANGHFDDCPVTLDPWTTMAVAPNTITAGTPGADDSEASPLSASARVSHSAAEVSSLAQCVAVEEGVVYDLAARWRFNPPMGALAQFEQTCEFFDGAACTGISLSSTSSASILEDEGGAWLMIGGEVAAPAGAVSALCDYAVELIGSDPNFDLYLDGLSLTSEGLTSLIFTDGFESGDTSAWPSTTP